MKHILILAVSVLIISKSTSIKFNCDIDTIKLALPPVIFFETTIDGPAQKPTVTRFFHNKWGIFLHEFAKCYAKSLEPNTVRNTVGLVGLLGWLYFAYKITAKRIYPLILTFLAVPLITIVKGPDLFLIYFYKIFAIIGFILLVTKYK